MPLLVTLLREPARMAALSLAEWDLALRQALAANLTATLYCLAEEAGVLAQVPPQARRHLEWTIPLARRHADGVRWEVQRIGAALARSGTPLILLKGAAYAMAGLAAGRGRLFSDIDILVPREAIGEVESDLMLGGWMSGHHDAYDQRYYRVWMHEIPPMQHAQRGSVIDVHHTILPLTARVRPDPDKLRAAARAVRGGCAMVLADEDMVLHSATHLFYDGEFDKGLRDLFDLHRLLGELGGERLWQALPARARELQLERPLFYALRYCSGLLGTPVPEHVLAALAPAGPQGRMLALMDALFGRALLPMHASCDTRFTALARFGLYVRGNWLRMPPFLLARHLFHKAFISPREPLR
ncbi:nucleotidyltransferase family protein [Massilia sp. PAMC28688]|uniref:nucleotidyltransferase domain-containing protein n=1 Tax=Massilia sp. PAMC28688 TaxID=2861283 RepID=UPI001E50F697|nr:nucleotidyltransferase family protein [Massilia sp. PAMC28688]